MELEKTSKKADAIANLYRAAFYLAKGANELGIHFLKQAKRYLGNKLDREILDFIQDPNKSLNSHKSRLYWVEKV